MPVVTPTRVPQGLEWLHGPMSDPPGAPSDVLCGMTASTEELEDARGQGSCTWGVKASWAGLIQVVPASVLLGSKVGGRSQAGSRVLGSSSAQAWTVWDLKALLV